MEEQAFKGTILEGRERRYTIINEKDVKNYLDKRTQERLVKDLSFPLHEIQLGRIADGKNPYNSYIVINVDEPYVDEIIKVMQRNGHWEGEKVQNDTNEIPYHEAMKLLKQGVKVDWHHEKNEETLSLFIQDNELWQEVGRWLSGVIEGVPVEMILEGTWSVSN